MYNYKSGKEPLIYFALIMIMNVVITAFSIWAAVEFALYLFKDHVFNFTSLWALGISIVVTIILTILLMMSEE